MSDKTNSKAASLATADEIFMRCAPALLTPQNRHLAQEVIERDKGELLEVLELLAEGVENQSKININTGMLACFVDPEFFPKFKRVMARHAERSVLEGVLTTDRHG